MQMHKQNWEPKLQNWGHPNWKQKWKQNRNSLQRTFFSVYGPQHKTAEGQSWLWMMIATQFPVSFQTPCEQEQGRRNSNRNGKWILDGAKKVKISEAPGPDQRKALDKASLRFTLGYCSTRLHSQLSIAPWSLLWGRSQGKGSGESRAQTQEPQCHILQLALELGKVSEFFYASLFYCEMRKILSYLPRRGAEKEEWMNVRHVKQCLTQF